MAGKSPSEIENRAFHNVAENAGQAIHGVLGSIYRLTGKNDPATTPEPKVIAMLLQSCEHMIVAIEQSRELSTGSTKARIAELGNEMNGKIGEAMESMLTHGYLPRPGAM